MSAGDRHSGGNGKDPARKINILVAALEVEGPDGRKGPNPGKQVSVLKDDFW